MDFPTLFEKVSPRLRRMARKLNGHSHFIDEDDLYQETCIHLWNNFKDGVPSAINEAYIIRGCKFHILNYIRKAKDKVILSSLEGPINEDGQTLRDILPDNREHPREYIDKEIAINEIKGNSLSKREKRSFRYY